MVIWFVRRRRSALRRSAWSSWCTSCLAHIEAIFKLPLGLCEPDPRSLCFALRCAAAPKLCTFRVVIRPNLIVESLLPFSLAPSKSKHLFLPRRSFFQFLALRPVDLRFCQSLATAHQHHYHQHHTLSCNTNIIIPLNHRPTRKLVDPAYPPCASETQPASTPPLTNSPEDCRRGLPSS